MQLLFADSLPQKTIAELEARGHQCVVDPGLGEGDLAGRIPGVDVLVVRSTQVPGECWSPTCRAGTPPPWRS